jgi:Pvc16 N-terminal domain
MIHQVFQFLADQLNGYLRKRVDDPVHYTHFVEMLPAGDAVTNDHAVRMILVNVEEEKVFRSQQPTIRMVNSQTEYLAPEVKLNLYILFSAHYSGTTYKDALQAISYIILFFQSHGSFTNLAYPALGTSIEHLNIELHSLNFEQQNQIWASLGDKYKPSVMYKVRMLVLQDTETEKSMPAITGVSYEL